MNRTILIIVGVACAMLTACLPLGMAAGCSSQQTIEPPAQTQTFGEWLQKIEHIGQYRDLAILKNLPKEKIIVVRNDMCDKHAKEVIEKKSKNIRALSDGNNDHIQDVLTKLGITHTLIGKSELEKESYSLDDKWAVLFNCNYFKEHCFNPDHIVQRHPISIMGECRGGDSHISHKTTLSDKTIRKIQRFVESGGYLFTEGLQIAEIIERTFRAYIANTRFLHEKDVLILPTREALDHPYLKDVMEYPREFLRGRDTGLVFRQEIKWRIDEDSPDIKILKKYLVTELLTSPDLVRKSKDGKTTNDGAVAVTFSVPDVTDKSNLGGQVLHIITHFANQKSKAGEFALQNLLVNFLEDCAKRHTK